MNLKIKITAFFFLLINQTFAQVPAVQKFVGVIKIKNGSSYFYQVNLEINGTRVLGTTITNAGTPNETTAAIVGESKNNGKKISFKETRIVKTAIKDKQTNFCFVNADLSLKTKVGIDILEGSFVGKDEKGEVCAQGTIQLARKNKIMADSVDLSKAMKKLADTIQKIQSTNDGVRILTTEALNTVTCAAKKVLVKFYDGNVIDGDRIEISYNGAVYKEDYVLTKNGIYMEFNIEKGKENIINVRTLNTGATGLNTVNIEVHTSSKDVEAYILEADANKNIRIKLTNG